MESVNAIMALPQEIGEQVLPGDLAISGNLRIKQLNFQYPEQKLVVLNNINLAINQGEKIGFYGSAGSGKSSLLSLMSGQYAATQGQIFFDDIEIDSECKFGFPIDLFFLLFSPPFHIDFLFYWNFLRS